MKNFLDFILEQNAKFVNVSYAIIVRDLKDNPTLLADEFEIIKSEDKKVTIKAKGYITSRLDGYNNGKSKKAWFAFDDFKDNKTRTVWNKNFENGSKRIKVIS